MYTPLSLRGDSGIAVFVAVAVVGGDGEVAGKGIRERDREVVLSILSIVLSLLPGSSVSHPPWAACGVGDGRRCSG